MPFRRAVPFKVPGVIREARGFARLGPLGHEKRPMKFYRPLLHAVRLADAVLFWPALAVVVWGEVFAPIHLHLLDRVNDKVLHFIAYFGLAVMAAAAFKGRRGAVWAVLALIVMGGVLEIVQGYVGRDMSLGDELANASGALIGGGMARMLVEFLRRRFGAW